MEIVRRAQILKCGELWLLGLVSFLIWGPWATCILLVGLRLLTCEVGQANKAMVIALVWGLRAAI